MRKKKLNLLDAYLRLCFGAKIVLENGKVMGYWDIGKGRALSFYQFEKWIYKQFKTDKVYEQQLTFL
jgi:hypothetical protein